MKKIFPKKPKKGGSVCVISPSKSFLAVPFKERILAEKRFKNELGLKIKYGKNIKERDMLGSSPLASRLKDLHSAFANKKVKAIICAYGGTNSNTLLPHINWDIIKNNPKPFIGYSDITALNNAIYAKTGLVTYSGPTFSDFATKRGFEYSMEYFQKCLFSKNSYEVVPSRKKNNGPIVLREGKAKGTIIGGSLCTLNLLQGTEYMPPLKDTILFLEDPDILKGDLFARDFERNLESLFQQKNARYIRGIVFGRFQKTSGMNLEKIKFIIGSKKLPKNIPIIANADFGHTIPAITFPIGGEVYIETKDGKAKIVILKNIN